MGATGAHVLFKRPMKNFHAPGITLILLFGIGTQASFTHAQERDPALLDELVITATRVDTPVADVPAAVSVIDYKDIAIRNVSRIGDALVQVPGLYLRGGALGQSQGTQGTSGMSLRGVDQSRVLVLLNGQPLQDASSGKVNWRVPFIDDIERIEVVPGAFSASYGSNAMGGVINIIGKQPDRHEFISRIQQGWGDASGTDTSVYLRDKLDNGIGFTGGLSYQDRSSYINDFVVKTPSAGVPGTPVVGATPITTRDGTPAYLVGDLGATSWRSLNATAKLHYDLNPADKIFTSISYQQSDQRATAFNSYLRNAATGAPVSSGNLDINGQLVKLSNYDYTLFSFLPLQETTTQIRVGYDGTLGDDFLLKADLAQISRGYQFTLANPTANWVNGAGSLSSTPNNALDGTLQLSFPLTERHFFVTGMAWHQDEVNQQISALSNWRDPLTITALNTTYNGKSRTASLFAQDEISFSTPLKLYLGGRWNEWSTQGSNTNYAAPATSNIFPSRTVSAFSPKISGIYPFDDMFTLRASFGQSFRAPTNQDLYTTSTSRGRTTSGDPNLQPEKGQTWELGADWQPKDEHKLSATIYVTELKEMIYLQQVSPTQSLRINAGKARIQGIDLSSHHLLSKGLMLEANYAYVDSKMLDNPADPLSVEKRLTDSPKNIAGLTLTARREAWTGVVDAHYYGHTFWTAQNTDVVEGVPGSYDAYSMFNASLSYRFSPEITGKISVNNLMDTVAYSYFLLPRRNLTAELRLEY